MTRTLLSRSKGQGHQAALLTAAVTREAGAAVTVRTYWAWETTATLRLLGVARGAGAGGARCSFEGDIFEQYRNTCSKKCPPRRNSAPADLSVTDKIQTQKHRVYGSILKRFSAFFSEGIGLSKEF